MKYDVNRAVVVLSVGELCSLSLQCGDLDISNGKNHRSFAERASIGSHIHKRLQSEAGADYEPEVPLANTTQYRDITFEISGRADGVIYTFPTTVDEIKTVHARMFDRAPADRYDAQLRCYAYLLASNLQLSSICCRLTYYCIEDARIKYQITEYTVDDLKMFYESLLERIYYRAQILIDNEINLKPTARCSKFPYPTIRDGQDIMLHECYRNLKIGKRLFIEAPTGTGKTLSALYPAIQALGKGYIDKIFYLTAKASTGQEAYHGTSQLFAAGAHLRTIILYAREHLCQNEKARKDSIALSSHCNPKDCPYAKGFYDKLGHAICEAFSRQYGFNRSIIEALANQFTICPYELQLEISQYCDIVICDYNYAFDPMVYLRRYFTSDASSGKKFAFLIDEAHNLGDRAADMYSAFLTSALFVHLFNKLCDGDCNLKAILEPLIRCMDSFYSLCGDTLTRNEKGEEQGYYLSKQTHDIFLKLTTETRSALENWLRLNKEHLLWNEVYRSVSKLKRFEVVAEYYDDHFLTFITTENGEHTIRLICLDPSRILSEKLSTAYASVLFSATLTPLDYFSDILGGGKAAVLVSLPSPFDTNNLCVVVANFISTRLDERGASYKKIVSCIAATASAKKGNYIVYFPSYDYMEQVLNRFRDKYPNVETIAQTKGMKASEKEAFLNAFRQNDKLKIGFCVLGGSFSEGVDLPGNHLIGSIIIGTGIPGLSNERNILREYYDNTRENGYDYAYTFPGMNRVLQAAGRVIRREDDKGIVVLIDDRYATERYTRLFPEHWSLVEYAGSPTELAEIAASFWKTKKK